MIDRRWSLRSPFVAALMLSTSVPMAGAEIATAVDHGPQVRVNGFAFDPLADGEPSLAEGSRAVGDAGFRLVQLQGATRDGWVEALAASGVKVLQYYPHHTYLVWSGGSVESAAAAALPFVRWTGAFHPAYKPSSNLAGRTGIIRNVDVMIYDEGNFGGTLDAIRALGGNVVQHHPAQPDRAFHDAIVELPAAAVEEVARLRTVLWLGYESPRPTLDDEMSSQIQAGNSTAGVPDLGYETWLSTVGLDGSGVRWAIVDTGIDYDHPDLGTHIAGGFDFPGACSFAGQPGSDCSGGGHGTHVAGIVGGDATGGFTDAGGFLYGLGVAPEVEFFAMNSLSAAAWPPVGGWQEHSKRAVLGSAIGGNNSWTTGEGTNHGYQASERTHDLMVRDGNFDTATTAEPFIEVFSAGNSGPGAGTLTAPKEAKNLIVTAASRNFRVGAIDTLASFSSRGPAVDGRIVPTITAPGEQIASSKNDLGGDCSTSIAGTNNLYAFCSGTSMASPHAAGAVVLLTDWWRAAHAGANPSPAMAKALLVNSAVDMAAADIPNFAEGWGRIDLGNLFAASPLRYAEDPTSFFGATGEQRVLAFGVPSPGEPVRVTLAWSDAPGAPGANPALVNDLNLTVQSGVDSYFGNRFVAGWSATGGTADNLNNLENVYLQSPASSITVTIDAVNIAGDGIPYNADTTDQDYVLVCTNCTLIPDFTVQATPASQEVCAPSNAVFTVNVGSILGFTDAVTLSASGEPAGTTVGFDTNPVAPPGSSMLTISNTGSASAGSYSITVDGSSTTGVHSSVVGLDLYTASPGAPTLVSPADGAIDVGLAPLLDWGPGSQSADFDLEVATDSGFSNIVYSASDLATSEHALAAPLDSLTTYYWRVRSSNACGTGSNSATFSFTTRPIPPTLLVDDDDDGPDMLAQMSALLTTAGESFDVWDTNDSDTNEPAFADLAAYKRILWFSGDSFGSAGNGPAGPGTDGEAALATWLELGTGNCLVLNSQDYLYDNNITSFGATYLGVATENDDESNTTATGRNFFAQFGAQSLQYTGLYSNFNDVVTTTPGTLTAFHGTGGTTAGAGSIYRDNVTWKTALFTIAIEAFPVSSRQAVFDRTMEYCDAIFQDGFDTNALTRWSSTLP